MSKYVIYKDSNYERPKNISYKDFASASYGAKYIYEPSKNPYEFYFFSASQHFLSEDYRKLKALKNTINYYFGSDKENNFDTFYNVTSSLINFNSNYIGSGLAKGSVRLNVWMSGTLVDSATDLKENGILSSSLNGKIGIVLYREGFILLNNSISLNNSSSVFNGVSDKPRWTNVFGNDSESGEIRSNIEYNFINFVPTNTLHVFAEKNELNHSNNITYINSGSYSHITGSKFFKENEFLKVKNIVKSDFISGSADFEKETYITRIGLFDKNKKLIGFASLANPVRKKENREFIFKLKLDI